MKKTLAIFSALLALVACTKEAPVLEESTQKESQKIKVNFTINRMDICDDTKAAVKTGWVENDVIFVFFAYVSSPKYLELKYNGTEWIPNLKNDLTTANISYWAGKSSSAKLTAIYLPYGNDYTVTKENKDQDNSPSVIQKDGVNYSGYFYYYESDDVHTGFTFDGTTLSGKITLAAPVDSGVLVHYDISGGFDSGHTYVLTQDYMKSLTLRRVNYVGGETHEVSQTIGVEIPGYYDANDGGKYSFISFSGVLDASAVGNEKNYSFVIHDKTDRTAYSRTNVGVKTISKNMYIGIGNITSANWTYITEPYFSVSPTKLVTFAPANLVYDAGTWKFHTNEYDCCFLSVDNGGTYVDQTNFTAMFGEGKKFDLFGWAATGWDEGGWSSYDPWIRGAANDTYGPSGDITGTNGDWGVFCTISGYAPGTWRLLTGGFSGESSYLLVDGSGNTPKYPNRNNVNSLRSLGTVAGVKGLIILPDNFVDPKKNTSGESVDKSFVGGRWASTATDADYGYNVYSGTDWGTMHTNGAVFLPLTGRVSGSEGVTYSLYGNPGYYSGGYWTSSNVGNGTSAHVLAFGSARGYPGNEAVGRSQGRPVRLVRDLN